MRIAQRFILISTLLLFLSPRWEVLAGGVVDAPNRPELPGELTMNEGAGSGAPVTVRVRTEGGEELRLVLDTGAFSSALDAAWEPKLGRPLGSKSIGIPFHNAEGDVLTYRAPKLLVGNAQLVTASEIMAVDLRSLRLAGGPFDGLLGMDCLRHYCIQLDFGARKIRFLDPERPPTQPLGKAIRIAKGPGGTCVNADFFGQGEMRFLIDTGFYDEPFDFMLAPKPFQRVLQQNPDGRGFYAMLGSVGTGVAASFARFEACGATYADIKLIEVNITPRKLKGVAGLRFVARHVATFNFPKQTVYFKPLSGR
jgi:hypothetical protein